MIGIRFYVQQYVPFTHIQLMATNFYYIAAEDVPAEDLVQFLWDEWNPHFRTVQTADVRYYGAEVRNPFNVSDPDAATLDVWGDFINGDADQSPIPFQLAVGIQRRADAENRQRWGRILLPGVSNTLINNLGLQRVTDDVTELASTELQAFRDKMQATLSISGVALTPCICSTATESLLPLVSCHVIPCLLRWKRRQPQDRRLLNYDPPAP